MKAHHKPLERSLALFIITVAFPAWAMAVPTLQVTLTRSDHHGFGVSCFGMKDGTLQASTTDGTAPYIYKWSNGASEATIAELAAGYYRVEVYDSNGEYGIAEITLEQPLPMKVDVDVYEYPNGYNISCYECNNGNAAVLVMGGAAPFAVSWSDGPTGDVRYNLGPKDYGITVADANGCEGAKATIYLRGPDRSDWSIGGNTNTTPGSQYIGTPDNKDVVLKSNGQERLRLKANGDIGLWGADTTAGMLYRDRDGILKIGGGPHWPTYPPGPCAQECCYYSPIWLTKGTSFPELCPDAIPPRIGSLTNTPVDIITNGQMRLHFNKGDGGMTFYGQDSTEAMRITPNGKVAIGTVPPIGPLGDYRLFVENGIATRDVLVKLGAWPDYVFEPNYALMPLGEMRDYIGLHKHLPGIPSVVEVEAKQGVELGDLQARMLKVVEEQALYILQLEENQQKMERRLRVLEASQH